MNQQTKHSPNTKICWLNSSSVYILDWVQGIWSHTENVNLEVYEQLYGVFELWRLLNNSALWVFFCVRLTCYVLIACTFCRMGVAIKEFSPKSSNSGVSNQLNEQWCTPLFHRLCVPLVLWDRHLWGIPMWRKPCSSIQVFRLEPVEKSESVWHRKELDRNL